MTRRRKGCKILSKTHRGAPLCACIFCGRAGWNLSAHLIEETLRYLGAADAPEALRRQVAGEAEVLSAQFRPRYVYRVWDLDVREDGVCLRGTAVVLRGSAAFRMLETCGQAALLACTLGARFDLSLAAVQARDMSRAVILDACGSALTEQGCDEAERELAARFPERYLTDRFSPGYGDLPLACQGDICAALDASRRLGLTVTESCLLNPVKSVTAVIGLSDRPQMARIRGCAYCQMRERCALRKGGKHCGN